ncbi:TlpA family protein disulfide reductase [Longibacter sp.]|uniref:TlpA family protein disulfide reductase n=1 Tax=Longibacter sp. TaxID=2045415 RepID=UPI003EB93736
MTHRSLRRLVPGRVLVALLAVVLVSGAPVAGQDADAPAARTDTRVVQNNTAASENDGDACPMGDVDLGRATETTASQDSLQDVTEPRPALTAPAPTAAEQEVREMLTSAGIHVVHFWAPWCPNARNELADGWGDLVRNNPDVNFVFITIWNDGESGASVLNKYDIPDRVSMLTLPDTGPSDNEDLRRRQFLGLPFTWSPSTWIFHQNGELAFAMNYGEMKMATIQQLIDNTRADW